MPTPGVSPLTFATSQITVGNLGGMCGKKCEQANYDTSTGTCGYVDTGSYACSSDDPQQLYYANLGTTDSGTAVDLRVTNMSSYLPWNADASGVNGEWGNINVIGNEPVFLEFCFIDAVRAPPHQPVPWHAPRPQRSISTPPPRWRAGHRRANGAAGVHVHLGGHGRRRQRIQRADQLQCD